MGGVSESSPYNSRVASAVIMHVKTKQGILSTALGRISRLLCWQGLRFKVARLQASLQPVNQNSNNGLASVLLGIL